VDLQAVERLLAPRRQRRRGRVAGAPRTSTSHRAAHASFLTDYQDAAYAQRYTELVERVRAAEQRFGRAAR
jgi:indolepyruvate ferredoxin oxidoreductase